MKFARKIKHKYPKSIGGCPVELSIGKHTFLRDYPGKRVYGHYGAEWTGTREEKRWRAEKYDEKLERKGRN